MDESALLEELQCSATPAARNQLNVLAELTETLETQMALPNFSLLPNLDFAEFREALRATKEDIAQQTVSLDPLRRIHLRAAEEAVRRFGRIGNALAAERVIRILNDPSNAIEFPGAEGALAKSMQALREEFGLVGEKIRKRDSTVTATISTATDLPPEIAANLPGFTRGTVILPISGVSGLETRESRLHL